MPTTLASWLRRGVPGLTAACCTVAIAWVGVWPASASAQAVPPARVDYPSLKLPFLQRLQRWRELANGVDREENFALGESLVRDSTLLHDQVWLPAHHAKLLIDAGRQSRGQQMLDRAEGVANSFSFRAQSDAGEAGHWKHFALYHLSVARQRRELAHFNYEAAVRAGGTGVEHAQWALDNAGFVIRDRVDIEDDLIAAHIFKADAEVSARRVDLARQTVRRAFVLMTSLRPHVASVAFLNRTAATVHLQAGDPVTALRHARQAVLVFDERGYAPTHIRRLWGRNVVQNVLVVMRQWDAANADFDEMDREVAGSPSARAAAFNAKARLLAYVQRGRAPSLIAALAASETTVRSRIGAEHPRSAMALGMLGIAQSEHEDPLVRARGHERLQRAAVVLVKGWEQGEPDNDGDVDDAVVRLIFERYLSAPSQEATEGTLRFQVAERLRDTPVRRAISEAANRIATGTADLGAKLRRLQDLRAESQWLIKSLMRSNASAAANDGGVQRLASIQGQRERLQNDIAQAHPQFVSVAAPLLPNPDELRAELAKGETFLSLVPVAAGVHAWAINAAAVSYRWLPFPLPELRASVEAVRASTDIDAHGGKLPAFDRVAAERLYRALLAPMEPALQNTAHLIVASAGPLAVLPWAALPRGAGDGDWLIQRFAVTQVPGAQAWLTLRKLASEHAASQPLLAWGDPQFAMESPTSVDAHSTRNLRLDRSSGDLRYGDIPPLPETRDELLAIARSLGADADATLYLGAKATRESVIEASRTGQLARQRVIAFATHGLMANDLPGLNQPALALAATGRERSDPLAPLLTLEDVMGLRLGADWVVLSACNTAAADGMVEDALSGLARGFFYAGARGMLVTHWAVESESAKLLTTATFEHYASHPDATKADSLRSAIMKVMKLPRYSHPAYWAPYALIGDGRR